MSRNRKNDKKSTGWGLVVFLVLMFAPDLAPALIPLVIVAAVVATLIKSAAAKGGGTKTYSSRTVSRTTTRYTTRQQSFDECPQSLFCRHKDKSEHHVRRGKEIDPWDRPDIDISKYQRNR